MSAVQSPRIELLFEVYMFCAKTLLKMLEFPYIPVCMETATLAKDLRKHPIPAEWQVFPKQRSGRSISATYITQLEFFVLERTSL